MRIKGLRGKAMIEDNGIPLSKLIMLNDKAIELVC